MKLESSYLGYLDNFEGMRKGRVATILDEQTLYNNTIYKRKDLIFYLLMEGYKPRTQKNYSHYSRRTGGYTKPKTLYTMENSENMYIEFNKTLINFAEYLIENKLINLEVAKKIKENEIKKAIKEKEESENKKRLEDEKRNRKIEKEHEEYKKRRSNLLQESIDNGEKYTEKYAKLIEKETGKVLKEVKELVKQGKYMKSNETDDLILKDIKRACSQMFGNKVWLKNELINANRTYLNKGELTAENYNFKYVILYNILDNLFNEIGIFSGKELHGNTINHAVKNFIEDI